MNNARALENFLPPPVSSSVFTAAVYLEDRIIFITPTNYEKPSSIWRACPRNRAEATSIRRQDNIDFLNLQLSTLIREGREPG